ncbi:hypothetical protein [Flavobacterium johnsoniae]|uniref:hypothetical protein n=1 Tax=Flavobacterium johnsoniae TaxID=986 RepID=UPI0013F4FB21|nr:hypothetical protein [Flavobacterium johnsoniae]
MQEKLTMFQKRTNCKTAVIRRLRKKVKKDGKNIKKRLVNVNKGGTFAPATATDVP